MHMRRPSSTFRPPPARRLGVPVPKELVDYWDRRLLEGRPKDWT
ncbi:MAG TPA: hypothetical protein VI997_12350 [Candidatus Thermoplasmatota archaeon]|nr:hypothetical protein [Candidatus Thermoplasmatota archaeon]